MSYRHLHVQYLYLWVVDWAVCLDMCNCDKILFVGLVDISHHNSACQRDL